MCKGVAVPLLSPRRLALATVLVLGITSCAPGPMAIPEEVAHTTSTQSDASAEPTAPAETTTPSSTPTPTAPTTAPVAEATTPVETASPGPTPSLTEPVTTTTPSQTALPAALLSPGDTSDKVRELQHRLLQLDWYDGRITDSFGDQTRLAVEGFQTKRGLPELGFVDQITWDKLVDMSKDPTHDEMHNVVTPGPALFASGAKGEAVKDIQARLKQVAWFNDAVTGNYGPQTLGAVEGFQAKRDLPVTGDVDQRTLDRLLGMTRKPTTDELNNVSVKPQPKDMRLDDRCLTGRVVCISKSQRKLAWVVDGDIRMTMDVRFGSELTPTRNGAFSVNWKSKNHVSSLYGSAMPYALFFSGGQAVHFSSDFQARGYNGSSHGCVNVRDKGAVSALFDATREGDKVVVYQG